MYSVVQLNFKMTITTMSLSDIFKVVVEIVLCRKTDLSNGFIH